MARRTFLTLAICLACVLPLCAQTARTAGDSDPVERELNMLAGQLADPTRTDKTKVEAAELLLIRTDPRVGELLMAFLTPSTPPNPRAQIAVAEAIARSGTGRKVFIDPLMAMLKGADEAVRLPAARALATYKNGGVLDKLVAIARSSKNDKAIRLATISAFRQVLDKKTVDVLIYLLDDPDAEITAAAGDTLAKLTNISAFRTNKELAKRWWRRNRSKKRTVWVADLADSLARANSALLTENANLRDRLREAMFGLYSATPAAKRDAMLEDFLNDPLGDVRLVGATVVERKIAANEAVNDEVRNLIRRMLLDVDPRCRQTSASLVASLGDKEALAALLKNLKAEQVPAVRRALYSALGKLRDPKALPTVLEGIHSEPDTVVAAAATALAKIASKQPLEQKQRTRAAEALVLRYRRASELAGNGITLREALLGAMGVLGQDHKPTCAILKTALKDAAATIRLAAVNALAQMGRAEFAADVAQGVEDADRGVRQAAISALATLGGQKALKTILGRTTAAESDDAVRTHAWDVVMTLLQKADAAVLEDVLQALADRSDAGNQRAKILRMLVDALQPGRGPKLLDAQRRLGAALLAAERPGEAAACLAEAYGALPAADSEEGLAVWSEWVGALLKANDPAAIKAMVEQKSDAACAAALAALVDHLGALVKAKEFPPAILLAREAQKALPARLTDEQGQTIGAILVRAQAAQVQADRQRVAELAPQLLAADESAREAAKSALKAMGERAVTGMLEHLKKIVGADEPSLEAEKAVLALLGQIAPKLTGYDLEAPQAERLKQIDLWLKG